MQLNLQSLYEQIKDECEILAIHNMPRSKNVQCHVFKAKDGTIFHVFIDVTWKFKVLRIHIFDDNH